jgi:hypothetical protein
MYLRATTQKRQDGSTIKHYQIAESVWNREKKRSEPRIVHNFGRVDDPAAVEQPQRPRSPPKLGTAYQACL